MSVQAIIRQFFPASFFFVFFSLFILRAPLFFVHASIEISPDDWPPEAITTLHITATTTDSVTLTWTAVSGNAGDTTVVDLQDVLYSLSHITNGEPNSEITSINTSLHPEIMPSPGSPGTVQSATIPNLLPDTIYYFVIRNTDLFPSSDGIYGTSFSNEVTNGPTEENSASTQPSSGADETQTNPSGLGNVQPREAIFSGKVFLGGKVELLVKNMEGADYAFLPNTTTSVDASGVFKVSVKPLLAEEYFFALKAKDKDGRETGTIGFPADFNTIQKFEKENIFFPPTIGSNSNVVPSGTSITILGYAFPKNDVLVEFDGKVIATVQASSDGAYSHTLESVGLASGAHTVRVRQTLSGGEPSSFSQTYTVRISSLSIPEADFNNDNTINIIDWSVFLTAWGSDDKAQRARADLDGDATVSISDFAIFLEALVVE